MNSLQTNKLPVPLAPLSLKRPRPGGSESNTYDARSKITKRDTNLSIPNEETIKRVDRRTVELNRPSQPPLLKSGGLFRPQRNEPQLKARSLELPPKYALYTGTPAILAEFIFPSISS